MDLHVKSQKLLESLANSLLDRGYEHVFFSIKEIHIVERFVKDFLTEEVRRTAD